MHKDAHGLDLTTASAEAAAAFDRAVEGYISFRADMPQRLAALAAADPDFAMAHVMRGYMLMLSFAAANITLAADCARAARACAAGATAREQAHIAALEAWAANRTGKAIAIWEQILAEHPHDVLALRLAHYAHFWTGRADMMLASILRVEPRWSAALPAWGTLLACRCFAHEECGHYLEAELAGRAALDVDPGDLWAAHGLAHVMEMQGRVTEGIAHIGAFRAHWDGANNVRHHLYWHEAMFHLERGDFARVLALYDHEFRDLDAPLTRAVPDLYIDIQNGASMLFRLSLRGVDVGDRWAEIADKAEARIGDCASAFTLPHWMMALAATGRFAAGERMLAAMRDYARGEGDTPALVARYALPVCEAVLARGRGEYGAAVAAMRPALGGMHRMGGSHAQQDVLEQLFLDCALRAGMEADARMLLERVAGRHKVPPSRRAAYAKAAREVGFVS
ncbi:MAG TPA: tetratricopeptide repeat protein [Acetobacteraceae bacterium]|nr:tetratricopeptide repeat protein [Acetobacteraceae bacterium]